MKKRLDISAGEMVCFQRIYVNNIHRYMKEMK